METWWSNLVTATAAISFTSNASRIGYTMAVTITMATATRIAMIHALAAAEPTWSPNEMWKPDEKPHVIYHDDVSGEQAATHEPSFGYFGDNTK